MWKVFPVLTAKGLARFWSAKCLLQIVDSFKQFSEVQNCHRHKVSSVLVYFWGSLQCRDVCAGAWGAVSDWKYLARLQRQNAVTDLLAIQMYGFSWLKARLSQFVLLLHNPDAGGRLCYFNVKALVRSLRVSVYLWERSYPTALCCSVLGISD